MNDEFGGIPVDEFGGEPVDEFGGVAVADGPAPTPSPQAPTPFHPGRENPALGLYDLRVPREFQNWRPPPSLNPFEGILPLREWFGVDAQSMAPFPGQKPTAAMEVTAGSLNTLIGGAEAMTSPAAIATMGAGTLPALAQRGVTAAWAAEMGRHLPEQAVDVYEKFKLDAPLQEKTEAVGGLGLGALLTGVSARGAAKGGLDGITREAPPAVPGEFPALPDPDLVARNIAAPGTFRPQEQRAWNAPEPAFKDAGYRVERGVLLTPSPVEPVVNARGEVIDVRPRIREVVIEEPSGIVPVERGAVRESPQGGRVSFAAEAPVLNREAIDPRMDPDLAVAERIIDVRLAVEAGQLKESPQSLITEPPIKESEIRPAPAISEPAPPAAVPTAAPVEGKARTSAEAYLSREAQRYSSYMTGFEGGRGIPVGAERINYRWAEAAMYDIRDALRQGKTLPEAEQVAKAEARKRINEHNKRRPKDINWTRDEAGADSYIERAIRELSELRPAPAISEPAPPAAAPAAPPESKAPRGRKPKAEDVYREVEDAYARSRSGEVVATANIDNRIAKLDQKHWSKLQGVIEIIEHNNKRWQEAPQRVERLARQDERPLELGIPPEETVKTVTKKGIIYNTPAEAWSDRTIEQGKKRLNTGLDPELLAAYVVKGAAHIERGIRKFSDWAAKMIAEHGDAIRPHLQAIWREAQAATAKLKADDGERMRKLSARASQSPDVPANVQAAILSDPASFYERQRSPNVRDRVAVMSNEELLSTPLVREAGPENIGIAARLEAMKRAFAAGLDEQGYAILQEASSSLTSFGQLVNQAKMLIGITPEHITKMLDKKLADAGQPPVQPSERIRIQEATRESIKKNVEWKDAERDWVKEPTDANFKRVEKAREDAVESDVAVQRLIHRIAPRTLPDMLISIEQGNVMSPISQAANVAGNLSFLQLEQASRTIAAALDTVDAFVRRRPREIAVSPIRGSKEVAKALGVQDVVGLKATDRALPKAWRALWEGGSTVKGEFSQTLEPLRAWRDLIAAAVDKQSPPLRQKGLRMVEASPAGMAAATMLRMLQAGDALFRTPAEARLITEAMKLQRLNERSRLNALAKQPKRTLAEMQELALLRHRQSNAARDTALAVKYPELFLSPEQLARIQMEGRTAVFQQPNRLARWITSGLAGASPWARFGLRQLALFIQTPINVIGRSLAYSPPGALVEMTRHTIRGDGRAAKLAAGRFVVGGLVTGAGYYLASHGLIAPTQNDPDTTKKERLGAAQVFPPGHINLSGIERLVRGEDPSWRAGDRTVNAIRVGGGGLLLLNGADLHYTREQQPEGESFASALPALGLRSVANTGQYAVQQSFLKGQATALDALVRGEFDKWFQSLAEGLTSIPLPNTMTAAARAGREFKPEIKGDSTWQTLENIFRNRLGAFSTADEALPYKRDLWGRPIRETPAGALPWVHQMFDVTKGQVIPDDSPDLALYALWRRTGDRSAWPEPPDKTLQIVGRKFPLTVGQRSELEENVGTLRRRMVERLTDNPNWQAAGDAEKLAMLRMAYGFGAQLGTLQFTVRHAAELEEKPKPQGLR